MDHDKLPICEYAKLPPRFNPTRFDADAWVKLARSAGARYITITTKHHDGFCMFASRLTDYDIVDATPYHADPLKALADACHQEKIKLFFYYSLLDWHHPDYFPLGKTGQTAGRPAKRRLEAVRRLLPGPGPRALHQLRRDRRHLVRRLVGQARRRLGPGGHLPADPRASARCAGGQQPSRRPVSRRRLSDVRAGPARRKRGGIQQGRRRGQAAAGNLPDDQSIVGLQRPRHALQERRADHPCPARGRGPRGQPALERRAAARRDDRPGIHPAAARRRQMARDLRRVGLRHPPRTDPAPALGRLDGQGIAGTSQSRSILHVFKLKDGTSIVFDPSFSWTPYLFGKPTPCK